MIGSDYGFTGDTCRVDLGGFTVESVAVKLWPMRSPSDDRELMFYRELAPNLQIFVPRFFAGDADPDVGRGWIVIEHLDGYRQGDDLVPESEASLGRIVDTLAAMHAATEGTLDGHEWLHVPARGRWDDAAAAERQDDYRSRFGPLPAGPAKDLFDALPRLIPNAHGVLDTVPASLLHRDLSFDNMLFRPPDEEPVILDWQRCEAGPGVRDLASILFTTTSTSVFDETIRRYERAVVDAGGHQPTPTSLDAALTLEFATRTLGVVNWAAQTDRGQEILCRWMESTPLTIEAWRSSLADRFDRLLGA